uniref:Thioredoxin domain-containing protein n=1 Tax=viral metagenome TaxID=1070528 RepID=A0A6C0D1G8_9ZZZZ
MEYNYSEDSLTKSTAEYNTLGEPNPLIASLPAFNPYPSMSYQYKNVTNDKVVLGYDALSHGPYSGSGYGTYDVSYPSACSSYYVLRCPSQQIVQEVSPVTASPSPSPSQPSVPMDVMTALKSLQINAYLDTSTMMGSKIGALLHSWGISKLVTVLPVQNSGYKAEMMSRGGTDSPYFFSNATGKSFQGVPSSINALLHSLSKSSSSHPPSMAPMPPMPPMKPMKEGYGCQSCGVPKKKQPKIDHYQSSSKDDEPVVYFLFHSKRCGHCKDLVEYIETDPKGQQLAKKMSLNVVDLDDLQKPEFATAFSHLQDLVAQVQGTPSLMRGKFNRNNGKFSMLAGDTPLLGKPQDIEKAYLSYHAEYEMTLQK